MRAPPCIAVISHDPGMERHARQLVPERYAALSMGDGLNGKKPELILYVLSKQQANEWSSLRNIMQEVPGIPVFVLAESPSPQEVVQAYEIGADEFLIFPVSPACLAEKLDKHLQQKQKWWHRLRRWWQKRNAGKPGLQTGQALFLPSFSEPHREPLLPGPVPAPDLYFHLLGPFEVWTGHNSLPEISGYRQKALLAYMIYHRHKHLHREILMEEFWAHTSSRSARNSLNVAISSIRQYFRRHFRPGKFIIYKNEVYQLNPALRIQTDVEAFSQWWEAGRAAERHGQDELAFKAFQQAAYFYGGDFLEDLPYEDWTLALRDNLRETHLQILKSLSEYLFQNGNYSEAAHLFREILVIDPCLEDIHRHLMFIYTQLGQRDHALRQYQRCMEALQRELGAEPSLETKKAYERILSGH